MPSASWALQKAIHQRLSTDAALLGLMSGAPRIYDDVPRSPTFPYITHGASTVRDWSTGTDEGHEHIVTLHVWSRGAGRKPVHELLGAIEGALDQQPLGRAVQQHHPAALADPAVQKEGPLVHAAVNPTPRRRFRVS